MPNERKKSFERKLNPGEVVSASDAIRVEPNNPEAERGLIASCLLDTTGDVLTECAAQKIRWEYFYVPAHQIIYSALMDLYAQRKAGAPAPNEMILANFLQEKGQLEAVGGVGYLMEIVNRVETPAHAVYWINIVREKYFYRQLIETSRWVIEKCYQPEEGLDTYIDKVEKKVMEISQDRISEDAEHLKHSVERAAALIETIRKHKGAIQGVGSGMRDLDKLTFGFKGGEMIVVAARPGMGKTAIALNFTEAAVLPKEGKAVPTLFFSLEMPAEQLALRMLCAYARVDSQSIRDGFIKTEDNRALGEAAIALAKAPMWIDDSSSVNILELRAKARRIHSREQIGLIVVDYLQLIYGTDNSIAREQQVAEISRGLKALSKELNVPVIVLAQLNRESEKDRRQPRISDLRESGSIEQDADMVLLLSKTREGIKDEGGDFNENHAVPRELIVAKNRNGPVGWVNLIFNKRITRFDPASSNPS